MIEFLKYIVSHSDIANIIVIERAYDVQTMGKVCVGKWIGK